MEILFTKCSGKYDRMNVVRPGAAGQSVDCPKQGIIPHEMVHYAVESVLQKRGFIARVVAGEAAAFQMESEPETDGVERLVEVFQADGWSGWSNSPDDMLELYRSTCTAFQCAPLAIGPADIEAVRRRILELTEQWRAVPVGKSLSLQF
jgi:hypothetical protein